MRKFLIAVIALGIITSCEKLEDDIIFDTAPVHQNRPSVNPKIDGVTVPFKSKFSTKPTWENPIKGSNKKVSIIDFMLIQFYQKYSFFFKNLYGD